MNVFLNYKVVFGRTRVGHDKSRCAKPTVHSLPKPCAKHTRNKKVGKSTAHSTVNAKHTNTSTKKALLRNKLLHRQGAL